MYKYKIGDIVTIKSRELIINLYSGINTFDGFYLKCGQFFNNAMFEFCEKKYCIRNCCGDGANIKIYYLKFIDRSLYDFPNVSSWPWPEICLQPFNKQLEFNF